MRRFRESTRARNGETVLADGRPVAALALMIAGGRLRRSFRAGAEQAAAGWNKVIDELSALGTDDLRAETERRVTERVPEKDVAARSARLPHSP
ncbi:hypothetical protein F0344_01370 [Streptomyces finlayi]|uniref:Uncharacterized protein n=1 Tax=Streptomyces finlayi TaxID=67296 RepID=A0A7G7BDM9_9ACTN|nr:hypothetical protein [Streptomyces finlayi]QNE73444.1 hypothetical protein F0344_01370 [Streptomyces finlayi]